MLEASQTKSYIVFVAVAVVVGFSEIANGNPTDDSGYKAGNESAVSTGLKVAVRWGRTSLGESVYPCITRDWRNPNRLLLSMV